MSPEIIIIAHNVRSCHNIGSVLRTADGIGVVKVIISGFSPYPEQQSDQRLPHLAQKISKQITKTALGAEKSVPWVHHDDNIDVIIANLKSDGYQIAALEQSSSSIEINNYMPSDKIAILIGNEIDGIDKSILALCDVVIEIPMFGGKESYNVVQATAMLLYRLRFLP